VTIRPVHPAEHAAVRGVVEAAFAGEPSVPAIVEELRATRRMVEELVAVEGDAVVGQVTLSRGWVDDDQQVVPVVVLGPLAVLPARQGAGIGTRLVAEALDAMRERGEGYVFLEGAPGYYGARGFERADRLGFERPSERIPAPAFQVAVLDDLGARGRLVYADAFWLHGGVGLRGETLTQVRAALGE
jgi:putative acetyltransferase